MEQDTRIPVFFGQQPGADDMVLLQEGFAPPATGHVLRFAIGSSSHLPGCSCCVARSPAASALAAAFRARATGQAPYFTRLLVLASEAGRLDMEAALAQDVLCRARFRLGG
jgi:hypothetical protein